VSTAAGVAMIIGIAMALILAAPMIAIGTAVFAAVLVAALRKRSF
jgi:hypothetical protein